MRWLNPPAELSRMPRYFTAYLVLLVFTSFVLISNPTFSARFSHYSQGESSYPEIQNFTVNLNQSMSTTISVPVDNLGSPINWTDLHLDYLNPSNGIKITINALMFEEGFVQAYSDNYSLRIGISIGKNVSLGSYTLPFTFAARSSTSPPAITTSVIFNVVIIVLKSPPAPFPVIFYYLAVIFIIAVTMIGIVLVWSRNWNISEVKK
jgi:hypothetical protein